MTRPSRKPTFTRYTASELPAGRTDRARVDATTDAEVARQIAEDPDTAPDLVEGVAAGWLVPVAPRDPSCPTPPSTGDEDRG